MSTTAVLTAGLVGGRLWDRALTSVLSRTPAALASVKGPDAFEAVVFSPDGAHAAVISTRRDLWLLHLEANRFSYFCSESIGGDVQPEALCFAPRHSELLVGVGCHVCIIDVWAHEVVRHLSGHVHKVACLDSSVLRGTVLSLSKEVCIVWDPSEWLRTFSFSASPSPLLSARLGRGRREAVAAIAGDGHLRLWLPASSTSEPSQLWLPSVDDLPTAACHVALGRDFVLAAARAASAGGLLVRWRCARAEQPPAVAEMQRPVQGLLVREQRASAEEREVALVLHVEGVDMLDLRSWRALLCVTVAASPQATFDAREHAGGQGWLLAYVDTLGALGVRMLDLHGMDGSATKAPHGQRVVRLVSPDRINVCSGKTEPASSNRRVSDQSLEKSVSKVTSSLTAALAARKSNACMNGSTPTPEELSAFLDRRGAFSDRLRPVAWRILLSLPGNVEAHEALVAQGEHAAFAALDDAFPLPPLERRRLCTALSALVRWAPELVDVPYLAALVFPVVQVFGADEVSAFEFVALFLRSWGQCWLDFLPLPPIGVLDGVAELLETADPELFIHLSNCSYSPAFEHVSGFAEAGGTPALAAIWPLLQTLLSEALPRTCWLTLWDHLVARWREPALLGACVVAVLRHRRAALLALPVGQPGCLDAELRRPCRGCTARQILQEADALLLLEMPVEGRGVRCGLPLGGSPLQAGGHGGPPARLPRGLAYPPLLLPTLLADHATSERQRLEAEQPGAWAARASGELAQRLRQGQARLAELERQVGERVESLAREREAHGSYVGEQGERLAALRAHARKEALLAARQRHERSDRDVWAAVQRQQEVLAAARRDFSQELERRRARREGLLRQALEEQAALGLEQRAAQRLVDAMQREGDGLAALQLERQAELWQRGHAELDESYRRAAGVSEELHRVRQRTWHLGSAEVQRLEELAHSDRMARTDVEFEALQRDLQIGRLAGFGPRGRAQSSTN